MPRFLTFICYTTLAVLGASCTETNNPFTTEFRNGLVFQDDQFRPVTFYEREGRLLFERPVGVDSVVDLQGQYVIPPMAEGHIHSFYDDETVDQEIQQYLEMGIFYVFVQGSIWSASEAVMKKLAQPHTVDVIMANGALVAPWYRTITDIYRPLLVLGAFGEAKTIEDLDGKDLFLIESEDDVIQKWPDILAQNQTIVKVLLAFGEEYEQRKNNTDPTIASGVDPAILPLVVQKAHEANRRVSMHIETASDFRIAVEAGADVIAHFPGWRIRKSSGYDDPGIERWLIAEADAKLAAEKGTAVVTTISPKTFLPDFEENKDLLNELHAQNFKMLYEQGVNVVIGSDDRRNFIPSELMRIADFEVVDNLTLLKLAVEDTPQLIFPDRNIGYLKEGYEASFLALEHNPLEQIENMKTITLAVKQGAKVYERNPLTEDSSKS